MEISSYASKRILSLGDYAFAEVDREVEKLRSKGINPIDFGVGDPTVPTPVNIRKQTQTGIDTYRSSGYPSYIGDKNFRSIVAKWIKNRFDVNLDSDNEISSSIGSKEAIFNFHESVIDPGDIVICPSPGYPPYSRGAIFSEGVPYFVPLLAENNFLIDFSEIPTEIAERAKVLWLNYPNSPSGAVATKSFYREAVEFASYHNIIIASDEAYSEIYFEEPPISILNVKKEGIIVFNSLSKRSAMTTYRIGWVGGDSELISLYRKIKTNIDSGTPTFIQSGAIAALEDETHVNIFREEYKIKRDILCSALKAIGLPSCIPDATIYVWQQTPKDMTSVEFATALLNPRVAIVTTPGPWISEHLPNQFNPGEGYVRFALVPSLEETKRAAKLLHNINLET